MLTKQDYSKLLTLAEDTALHIYNQDPDSGIHGKSHWKMVASVGVALAQQNPGINPKVCHAFGLLHDCCRMDDCNDSEHGHRSSELVENSPIVRGILNSEEIQQISEACYRHNSGRIHSDQTVGTCLDADRLTLGRVGKDVDLSYISTEAAREFLNGKNFVKNGQSALVRAFHGTNRDLRAEDLRPQQSVLYTALDFESANFYGDPISLCVSCDNLADLTDPFALIHSPIFERLKEFNDDEMVGESESIFDHLEAGTLYQNGFRRRQESFIRTVLNWGYSGVLINDVTHSRHPTLALGKDACWCAMSDQSALCQR